MLFARRFDIQRLRVVGGQIPVLQGVRRGFGNVTALTAESAQPTAQFDISDDGSLVYIPGPASLSSLQQELVLTDRNGVIVSLKLPAGPYQFPRVSPDGKRIAFESNDGKEDANVSVYDLAGGALPQRLTFNGRNRFPLWSRDGQSIVFQSDREGDLGIFRQRIDGGSGSAERITTAEAGTSHMPESWSPSGDTLLFNVTKGSEVTLEALSLRDKKRNAFPGVRSTGFPNAVFSPDGRWVVYSSRGTGQPRSALFVEPFPPTGAKYQVTSGISDAHFPVWSPDGNELLFVDASRPANGRVGFVVVTVGSRPGQFSEPTNIPRPFYVTAPGIGRSRTYDIMPDGQRFLGVIEEGLTGPSAVAGQIQVVLNWTEELKQRVPTR
jgi:serine/threonine-protein kinase